MSEPGLRQSYEAIIRAVAAADKDALNRLIIETIVDHSAVTGQAPGRDGIMYWMATMHDTFADLTGVDCANLPGWPSLDRQGPGRVAVTAAASAGGCGCRPLTTLGGPRRE
jgi:hypothetical protein